MGNCLHTLLPNRRNSSVVSWEEEKLLRIMKPDGKVMEYRESILVRDLLTKFDAFGVRASGQEASEYLPSTYELRVGEVYHLLPLHFPTNGPAQKEVGGGKRMKVIITKQELRELLSKKISMEGVLCKVQSRKKQESFVYSITWRPQLQTIPEEQK